MTGIGGGIILIPILTLIGVPIKYAIAASLLSTIATSSGSASAYVRDRLSNIRIGMYLEMFTVVGAIVGATIVVLLPSQYTWILFFAFAAILLLSWWQLLTKKGHEELPFTYHQDKFSHWLGMDGIYYDKAERRWIYYKARRASYGGAAMFGAGMIAGLLGIGAGAVKVTIHDLIMNMPGKVSTTTSNFIIGVTALSGVSVFLASGLVNLGLVAPIAIGVTTGAILGTKVLVKMKNLQVRKLFLVVLFVLAAEMILRGAGVLH
ncbi:MAG: sulfite exporter TauE/SafE family protein [Nitrososphaerota archaeon]|nr:sulfite exporter TauE/SafE family protein [Nitrososphaerota archaeon]